MTVLRPGHVVPALPPGSSATLYFDVRWDGPTAPTVLALALGTGDVTPLGDVVHSSFSARLDLAPLASLGEGRRLLLVAHGPGGLPGLHVEVERVGAETLELEIEASPWRLVRLLEVYAFRDGWRVRADGQGYSDGIRGLARDLGVDESLLLSARETGGAGTLTPTAPPPGALRRLAEQASARRVLLTPTLRGAVSVPPAPVGDDVVLDRVMLSPTMASQRRLAGRRAPSEDVVRACLTALLSQDGRLPVAQLAAWLHEPTHLVRGLVSNVQAVLNVDGAVVLELEAGMVELNRFLLLEQFSS